VGDDVQPPDLLDVDNATEREIGAALVREEPRKGIGHAGKGAGVGGMLMTWPNDSSRLRAAFLFRFRQTIDRNTAKADTAEATQQVR
jgi:hypothetical protein